MKAKVRMRSKMRVRRRVRMMPFRASIAYEYVLCGSVGQLKVPGKMSKPISLSF
jgi:hypothetical protein